MQQVKKSVKKLITQYQTRDPFMISDLQNILILNKKMPSQINGMAGLVLGQAFIVLNEGLSNIKRRFVCAHELGHHQLHPSESYRFLDENTFNIREKEEREANEFATYLLLEAHMVSEGYPLNIVAMKTGIPLKVLVDLDISSKEGGVVKT